ncbi:MAG: glycosyltransferase family 2 protein [Bacteroidetes bacterium]|nr:glycosyltransferase family 2 protein [Bacteroidota bacterium]
MSISVVIPCFNEQKYIIPCLESVCTQQLPAGETLEVFVCDGRSSDNTPTLIHNYIQSHPQVKLLINEQRTTPYALNLGIQASASDVVVIFGAHAVMKPGYLMQCLQDFSTVKDAGCVGGIIDNIYENKNSQTIGLAMSSPFGVGNAHFRTGMASGYVDTVAFGAYKREVFNKIGLFDTELARNQDDEFNFRLLKNGFKIWLNPSIRSDYYVRSSIKKLYRQYFQYGYWKVYVNKKHKAITTVRQLIPFFFVLFLITGVIASVFSCYAFLAFIGILGLYKLIGHYFAYQKTKSFMQAVHIVFVFFILHLSYGLGYLLGVIHFLILNRNAGNQFQGHNR